LNAEKFSSCLEENKYWNEIKSQIVAGEQAGVIGAPTSFINGDIIIGAIPYEDFTDSSGRENIGLKNIIEKYLE
ncbi:MAG: DsbA family protein, partial [bacterium]